MASSSTPRIYVLKADAAIAKGKAVKAGASDSQHVQVCAATTDKSVAILQAATTAAGDKAELAFPGGGAKALAGGVIAFGDLLAPTTDGSLIATTTPGDRYIAMAMDSAVSGDLFAVEVVAGLI